MADILCQIALLTLSGGAIGLLALGGKWARYGFILGLLSEVFWLRLALVHSQIDVLLLTFWWGGCYGFGLWRSLRREKT